MITAEQATKQTRDHIDSNVELMLITLDGMVNDASKSGKCSVIIECNKNQSVQTEFRKKLIGLGYGVTDLNANNQSIVNTCRVSWGTEHVPDKPVYRN